MIRPDRVPRNHVLTLLAVVGVLLATAMPASAGTVYVPLMVDQTVDGHLMQTEVSVANTSSTEIRAFRYYFLPSGTDGTVPNRDLANEIFIAPRASAVFDELIAPDRDGILEIEGDPDIVVSSRLISTADDGTEHDGSAMPILGASTVFQADETAVIQGWTRTPGVRQTDFHAVNMGSGEAMCIVSIRSAAGGSVLNDFELPLPPLSHVAFPDALALVGVDAAGSMSSTVSCDRPFYSYITTLDLEDGETVFIAPSTPASDSIDIGGGPGPGPDPGPLPDGSFVWERQGLLHQPSPAEPMKQFNIPMETKRYSKVTLDMEFTPNGWGAQSHLLHSIFWFNRQPAWKSNLFGYFNAFGPGRNEVKLSYNVGLSPGDTNVTTAKQTLQSGVTYKVHWEYDTNTGITFAEVRNQSGALLSRCQMPTGTNAVWAENGGFFLSFGFSPFAHGPEQVTYGWKYSNVRIVFTP